jgi:diguanylate cyclase (GGDEF)-like protein
MLVEAHNAPGTFEAFLDATGDLFYVWDLEADTLAWSGSPAQFGLTISSAPRTGPAFRGRVNVADLPLRQQRLSRHLRAGEAFECEYRFRCDDGSSLWVEERGGAESGRLFGVLRALGARKDAALLLERQAHFDALTGQFNRARLREGLQSIIDYVLRGGGSAAYLVVGIDNLALVNEAYGNLAADELIGEVARRLDRCLASEDVIGRLGGDRFGIVLGNCARHRIEGAAERIRAALSRAPVATQGGRLHVTVSIGAVALPEAARDADEAMTRAETALGQAKRAGRDCFVAYDVAEGARAARRAEIATTEGVHAALREDRLLFAYQPVVASDGGRVDYWECLLRLRECDGAVRPAGEFMPAMEGLGFIRLVDRFVLERACALLTAEPAARVGFNVSVLTASDRSWLRAFAGLLEANPTIAPRIVVELTETAVLADGEETAAFVRALRELGCRVALDDFGAGFTSLRHLRTLAIDTVKIDGALIGDLPARREARTILRHSLGLARGLGLATVAECVETEAQAEVLRGEGVDYLQGWLFGRPVLERPWASAAATSPFSTGRRAGSAAH